MNIHIHGGGIAFEKEKSHRILPFHQCRVIAFAQRSGDVNRARHSSDSVLGEHDHPRPIALHVVDQLPRYFVYLAELWGELGRVGPELLKAVVEVRQVH